MPTVALLFQLCVDAMAATQGRGEGGAVVRMPASILQPGEQQVLNKTKTHAQDKIVTAMLVE
jgi:hypothetical protein